MPDPKKWPNGSAPDPNRNLQMFPHDAFGNVITRATVRGFGNAGIVTSQLANEISLLVHVYDGTPPLTSPPPPLTSLHSPTHLC